MKPNLTLEQLQIGMTVQLNQLSGIYDTYILLSKSKMAADNNGLPSIVEGTIEFIGAEQNEEYSRIREQDDIMVVIFTPDYRYAD